jgi:hypothetical protein
MKARHPARLTARQSFGDVETKWLSCKSAGRRGEFTPENLSEREPSRVHAGASKHLRSVESRRALAREQSRVA